MSRPPESWIPAGQAPRGPETVSCSLCGTTHPAGLMVADGGAACADVRWYCTDVLACTQRWTARSPSARRRAAAAPPAGRNPAERGSAERSLPDRAAQPVGATPSEA
ncbi:MAG: hypothetical protein WAK82_39195 [Streptosporangiaceae bacterium]